MILGIIGAMPVEIEVLKEQLNDLNKEIQGSFEFYSGTLEGVKVVVLLSGIGKVSATVATTLLIERYKPDYIINTGTAGGLKNVQMGDVVLGIQVGYHDADLTVFGYKLGQMAQQPYHFIANEYLVNLANEAFKDLDVNQNVLQGLILSGDQFMNDPVQVERVKDSFPDALAVEMESAAIAQTCFQLEVPFIVIRSISDMAGDGDSKSYDTFVRKAGAISAQMIINCIKKIK